MKQSSILLVEPAENLRYFMSADLELGCRWGARGATSVTEVFSEAFFLRCSLVNVAFFVLVFGVWVAKRKTTGSIVSLLAML